MNLASPWLLSADSHVVEPPEVWDRVDREWRDQAPKLVADEDADWLYFEGRRLMSYTVGVQPGKRFEGLEKLKSSGRWSDVVPGAYEAEAHLAANSSDGVFGSVVYPTVGLFLYRILDRPLFSALARAYNDWVADFCAPAPGRLKATAVLNVDDVGEAVAELQRCRALGIAGANIPCFPLAGTTYDDPDFDPLWAAAQDLEMPLCMHTGSLRANAIVVLPGKEQSSEGFGARHIDNAIFSTTKDFLVRIALCQMIFSGVFAKYPRLRIGSVEHESGWVPSLLDRMDSVYTTRWYGNNIHRYADGRLPSDVFRSNVFVTFQEDTIGIRDRAVIGVENLMFGTDFPHTETTYPRSRAILDELLADVPASERELMTWGNVARVFGFDAPPAEPDAGSSAP